MLLILAQWLQDDLGFLRVFNYITFRAVMATVTALLIGLAAGPWVIRKLTALKMGQAVRTDGPQSHLVKSGTPTMGGVLILIGIFVSCMLWADLSNRFIWIVMIVTFGFGLIGWVDDYRKVAYKDPKGMASREKFFWQTLIGLFAAIYLAFSVSEVNNLKVLQLFYEWVKSGFALDLPAKTNLLLPFIKEVSYPLGMMGFIILSYLVIVGSSNAVNLTDGLDGWLARYCSWQTPLGSCLDPFADKLLVAASFISLALIHQLPWWLVILVFMRDFTISTGVLAWYYFIQKEMDFEPTYLSKINTVLQLGLVTLCLFELAFSPFNYPLRTLLIDLTAFTTAVTYIHYVWTWGKKACTKHHLTQ